MIELKLLLKYRKYVVMIEFKLLRIFKFRVHKLLYYNAKEYKLLA